MTSTVLKWNTRIYIIGSASTEAEWAISIPKDGAWGKLDELSSQWQSYDMVGVIPAESFTPAAAALIESVIKDDDLLKTGFHAFDIDKTSYPPTLAKLIDTICKEFDYPGTKHSANPWICSAVKLQRMLTWLKEKVLPMKLNKIINQSDYFKKGADIHATIGLIHWKLIGGFFEADADDTKMLEQFSISNYLPAPLSSRAQEPTEYNKLVSTKKAIYSEISSIKGLLEEEVKRVQIAEHEITELTAKYGDVRSRYDALNAERDVLKSNIANNEGLTYAITNETTAIRNELAAQNAILDETKTAHDAVKKEYEKVYNELVVIKASLEQDSATIKNILNTAVETTNQIEIIKQECTVETAKLAPLTNTREALARSLDAINHTNATVHEEIDKQKQLIAECSATYEQLLNEKAAVCNELVVLKGLLEKEKNTINIAGRAILETAQQIDTMQRNYTAENAKVVSLTAARDDIMRSLDAIKHKNTMMDEEIVKHKQSIEEQNATYALANSTKNQLIEQISSIKAQINKENKEIELTGKTAAETNKQLDKAKQAYQESVALLAAKNKVLDKEINAAQAIANDMKRIEGDILKTRDIIAVSTTKRDEARTEHDQVTARKNTLVGQVTEIKGYIGAQEKLLAEANKNADALTVKKRELTSALDTVNKLIAKETLVTQSMVAQTSSANELLIKQRQTNAADQQQLLDKKKENDNIHLSNTKISAEMMELKQTLVKEKNALKLAEKELADNTRQLDTTNKSLQEITVNIQNITKLLANSNAAMDELNAKKATLVDSLAQQTTVVNAAKTANMTVKAEYDQAIAALSEAKNQAAKYVEQIKLTERAIAEINKKSEPEKKRYLEILNAHDSLIKSLDTDKEKIEEFTLKSAVLQEEIAKTAAVITETKGVYEHYKADYDTLSHDNKLLQEQLSAIMELLKKEKAHHASIEDNISVNTAALEKGQLKSNKLLEMRTKSEKNLVAQQAHLTDIMQKISEYTEAIADATTKINEISDEYEKVKFNKNNIQVKLTAERLSLNQEISRVKMIERSISETERNLNSEESKYKALSIELKTIQDNLDLSVLNNTQGEKRMSVLAEQLERNDLAVREITILIERQQEELDALELINKEQATISETNATTIMSLKVENRTVKHINEYLSTPPTVHAPASTGVRIYILCHDQQRLREAATIYGKYSWAMPVLMKYQDCTFENAFWKQLYEMRDEWYKFTMVGTLSFKAYKKINLDAVDKIIKDPKQWESEYYHFMRLDKAVSNNTHQHLVTILSDVCKPLGLKMPMENCCNYWMCSAEKMIRFLIWFEEAARPTVMSHPLSMTNATYMGALTKEELLQLDKYPFYTHAPFVFERLFISFFIKIGNA